MPDSAGSSTPNGSTSNVTTSAVSAWAVREQLEQIEQSPHFADSGRLRELLTHLVEATLGGNGASLKEAAIGNAIYAREPPYDPRFDSTVRVEARRLRRKLKAYYAHKTPQDRVHIELPTGSYVPVFSWITGDRDDAPDGAANIFRQGTGAVLAIMPFTALSNEPDDPIFADELTDELIFAMEQAEGYRIASRATTFQYKNKPYSIVDVARELGADGVLQGTVRRNGALVRVTVELSDPAGLVSWSDRFDVRFENRLQLQERIAATILSRSRFDSSKMRSGQFGPKPSALQANAAIYRARQLLDRQAPDALRRALAIFSQVAATAADYARGYTGIADCHCDLFRLGVMDRPTALAGASAAAARAIEIDPASIEAHTAMATIHAWLEWNREAAEAAFGEAMRLGGNARCARLYGVFLTYDGRHAEAGRMFKRARVIEPISTQQDCAEALCDYQGRHFAKLTGDLPRDGATSPEVTFYRGLALALGGRAEDAGLAVDALDAAGADYPLLAFAGAEIRAWTGHPEQARLLLQGDREDGLSFAWATLAMASGDHDTALSGLEQAVERREPGAVWMRTDARFDAVRGAPRFADLLRRLDAFREG